MFRICLGLARGRAPDEKLPYELSEYSCILDAESFHAPAELKIYIHPLSFSTQSALAGSWLQLEPTSGSIDSGYVPETHVCARITKRLQRLPLMLVIWNLSASLKRGIFTDQHHFPGSLLVTETVSGAS